jgi:hypothetical protein
LLFIACSTLLFLLLFFACSMLLFPLLLLVWCCCSFCNIKN